MAIQLKQASSYDLLPKFGVSAQILTKAKQYGVDVIQDGPGNFKVKFGNQTYGVIPVKGQAITLAKQGSLGPASKQALQFQFEAALKKAIESASLQVDFGEADTGSDGEQPTAVPAPKPKVVFGEPKAPKSEHWNSTDAIAALSEEPTPPPKTESVSEAMMKAPCALHMAKVLYQPVTATSKDSVYHVVALFDGLNLAARVAGGKLSLRAEGSKIKKYTSALADLGMAVKNGHEYASVHFTIDDAGLLLKTFGAVLGRLGMNNIKEAGDILVIKGAGK